MLTHTPSRSILSGAPRPPLYRVQLIGKKLNRAGFGLIASAFLLIVAGSHLGMLWLANYFLVSGARLSVPISPEQVTGLLSALFLAAHFFSYRDAYVWGGGTTTALVAFCLICAIGEILRPDIRVENLSTFVSFLISYFIGIGLSSYLKGQLLLTPILRYLLGIYALWYFGLLYFFARGDLGFFDQLEGAFNVIRLAFSIGFSATEIPMWIGLHVPILLYTSKISKQSSVCFLCIILIVVGTLVVFFTASVAAMIAYFIIFFIFFSNKNVVKLRGLPILIFMGYPLVVIFNIVTNNEFLVSVVSKFERLFLADGARGAAYDQLLYIMQTEWMGIGKGRFVESNNFAWNGEGIYPHNNYLGIGAEMGWIALILYLFFIINFVRQIGKAIDLNEVKVAARATVLKAVMAIFMFQQIRGFLHDTWILKELYLWAGLGIGLASRKVTAQAAQATAKQIRNQWFVNSHRLRKEHT